MQLLQCFERVFVINSPGRRDRRRDMERQLRKIGWLGKKEVVLFDGIHPDSREDWPSIGARGCFLSHYTVLKQARDAGWKSVAVLEDDCDFTPPYYKFHEDFAVRLEAETWGIAYLGHYETEPAIAIPQLRPWTGHVRTNHFYAVHRSALERLVDYCQSVQARPAGHPLGGPQYLDGAFSTFSAQNPDVRILLAFPSLGRQRSSRSGLNPKWFDRTPGLRLVAEQLRRFKRFMQA